jgi:3-oxoadipate enol-lactonase
MALQRANSVPRLALINSLATYRIDHWRKWLEARGSSALVSLCGMRFAGRLFAARLFPHPWQRSIRERAARVIGAAAARSYLGLMKALENWSATDRLGGLTSRIMMIAAEHDFVPLADTQLLASCLRANLIMIRGSHHGTPFDSVKATNANLLALLTAQPPPSAARWACDEPKHVQSLAFDGSLAEEHALGA